MNAESWCRTKELVNSWTKVMTSINVPNLQKLSIWMRTPQSCPFARFSLIDELANHEVPACLVSQLETFHNAWTYSFSNSTCSACHEFTRGEPFLEKRIDVAGLLYHCFRSHQQHKHIWSCMREVHQRRSTSLHVKMQIGIAKLFVVWMNPKQLLVLTWQLALKKYRTCRRQHKGLRSVTCVWGFFLNNSSRLVIKAGLTSFLIMLAKPGPNCLWKAAINCMAAFFTAAFVDAKFSCKSYDPVEIYLSKAEQSSRVKCPQTNICGKWSEVSIGADLVSNTIIWHER